MTSEFSVDPSDRARLLETQANRLFQAARLMRAPFTEQLPDDIDDTIRSLSFLLYRAYDSKTAADLWLCTVATSGVFPSDHDMESAAAFRDNASRDEFFDWFIAASATPAVWGAGPDQSMKFVGDTHVVVDVSSCARFDRHTGIQRVERETLPLWAANHNVELVAWTERSGVYRSLTTRERARVLEWKGASDEPEDDTEETHLIVPWGTTIVLPEVPDTRQSSRLRTIARFSGNRIAAIGYDVIPLTSPELLPRNSGTDFVDYLGMIKYASAVAGISRSATEEFRGYFDAIGGGAAEHLVVETCELPTATPVSELNVPSAERAIPVVLCVGSHEPRKNHIAVLHAAERLWREGLDFELWFFGGGGWGTDFDEQAEALRKRGRKVLLKKAVTDSVLWAAYRDARFTVFPSLHEGFGLPAAESMAFGTPVITTDYGSTREIAERGGAIMVDPRSDSEIHDAMRLLLTDDEVYSRLVVESTAVPPRTWDAYAEELWTMLVESDARG